MYVFQVATPFSIGTGIYLPGPGLIVTNEHVVRDSAAVVVGREGVTEQLAPVVYLDAYYDLAFLRLREPIDRADLVIAEAAPPLGTPVSSVGQHFGEHRRTAHGTLLAAHYAHHGISYLLHDARDAQTLSGSGLYDAAGRLLGINMQNAPEGDGNSLALPAVTLRGVLHDFAAGGGAPGARCLNCRRVTFETPGSPPRERCPHCGEELTLPSMVDDLEPTGVNATIEAIIRGGGHDPRLARRGPNLWKIRRGSATIQLAYHEESGLVTGDAYLCQLPEEPSAELLAYLLRENARLRQLSFSTYGRDIILSLLIYDRYLSVDTALPRFEYLFEQADDYDNILVEAYGAGW